jgi:hypothetical protein
MLALITMVWHAKILTLLALKSVQPFGVAASVLCRVPLGVTTAGIYCSCVAAPSY